MTADKQVLYDQAMRLLAKALDADPDLASELEDWAKTDGPAPVPARAGASAVSAQGPAAPAGLSRKAVAVIALAALALCVYFAAGKLATAPPTPPPKAAPVRAPTPAPEPVQSQELPMPKVAPIQQGKAGIEWVKIPGGSFMMGSKSGGGDEKPVHRVAMRAFQMAKTEVTNKQYRACVEAGACTPAGSESYCESASSADDQPVVCVDWTQAKAFAAWAGGRLPSEAEWEYAARSAGLDRKYPWGNEDATCERAVMYQGGNGCGRNSTWPVCSKAPGNTEQGLCDMAGNVWEWTQDWYHDSYNGSPNDGSAWEAPAGSAHVIRGGSWSNGAANVRAAGRDGDDPGGRGGHLGFRPVR